MQLVYNRYTVRDKILRLKEMDFDCRFSLTTGVWKPLVIPITTNLRRSKMSEQTFFCWMRSYGEDVAADLARAEGVSEQLIYTWVRHACKEHDLSLHEIAELEAEFSF